MVFCYKQILLYHCHQNHIHKHTCSRQFCLLHSQAVLTTVKCAVVRLRALMAQQSARLITNRPIEHATRVFNDLIDDFTKSDFKSFWDDFVIFKIILKYGDLI
jgi:hypothetical protein